MATSAGPWRIISWSSTFSAGSVTATPTSGRGSPGSGPSPPSCRSVTTLSWRSLLRAYSLGPPPLRGPRPPPRLLSLPLRPVPPPHHSRLFLVPFPPGRAGVGGVGAAAVVVVGDVEQVVGATRRRRHLHGVHPGHPTTTHGQGASLSGRSRFPVASLARRRPCSRVLPRDSPQ